MTMTLTLADIQEMDVEEFVQLVRANMGFPDPRTEPAEAAKRQQLWILLTDPSVINQTERMLVNLLRAIDDQLASRKAAFDAFHQQCSEKGPEGRPVYFQGKGEYEAWRRGILDNKRVIGLRHSNVKQVAEIHRRRNGTALPTPPNPLKGKHNLDALFRLAYAVTVRHRDGAAEEDITPLPHDLELYQAAEKITVMFGDGRQISLSDWVEEKMAEDDFVPPDDL